MIEVIEKGEIPAEKRYECRCLKCNSLLRFKRDDANYVTDQRDGDYLVIRCPVCLDPVNVDTRTGFTRPDRDAINRMMKQQVRPNLS